MTLPTDVIEALRAAGATVATAESLTGGMVCAALVDVPGASDVFRGGVVAYTTEAKTGVLGVDPEVVGRLGTVAEGTVTAMATRARELLHADYGVATTGVAGPESSEGHPPGTVFVAVAGPEVVEARRLQLEGDRAYVRTQTVGHALAALLEMIGKHPIVGDVV